MAPAKKDLQKFTESESKVSKILELERITEKDLTDLTVKEKNDLQEIIVSQFNTFKGEKLDELVYKIDDILPIDTRNQLWENNHYKISVAMTKLMKDQGFMPTKNQIAVESGLSRQTIHKHINDYSSNPLYLKDVEQFRFLSNKVLARVFKFAVDGDLKACRLYFDIVGNRNTPENTPKLEQKNYIQINNTVLSQDELKQLNEHQLNTIESVLKTVLCPDNQPATSL